ncbi:MAG: hypothetical protein Q8Q59_03935 [Luteolibacter sp.]|jgi:hypothetical protein|nr:hypothetical protein [Luteolibacter sp.]
MNINNHGLVDSNYLGLSGIWRRSEYSDPSVDFYNPFVVKTPAFCQSSLQLDMSIEKDVYKEEHFIEYAEALQRVGDKLKQLHPHVMLVPLRGAERPWRHLQIYCDMPITAGCVFPFTGNQKRSDETRETILRGLLPFQFEEELRIACVDGAEGGHGSRALLDILSEIHAAQGKSQIWRISLFLLVPADRNCSAWKSEHEMRGDGKTFFVKVALLPMSNVIGEDKEGAMIDPRNFNRFQEAKVEEGGETFLIETAELPAVIDLKITHAFHDVLRTEPGAAGRSIIDVRICDKPPT